jgi:hypothetical protein
MPEGQGGTRAAQLKRRFQETPLIASELSKCQPWTVISSDSIFVDCRFPQQTESLIAGRESALWTSEALNEAGF